MAHEKLAMTALITACAALGCAPRVAPAAMANTAPLTEAHRVSEDEPGRFAAQSASPQAAIATPQPADMARGRLQRNSAQPDDGSTPTLSIALDVDGRLYLDGFRVDEEDLQTKLRSAYRADPLVSAVLSLDGRVAHIKLVKLIELLQRERIGSFVIRTSNEGKWPSCRIPPAENTQGMPGTAAPCGHCL